MVSRLSRRLLSAGCRPSPTVVRRHETQRRTTRRPLHGLLQNSTRSFIKWTRGAQSFFGVTRLISAILRAKTARNCVPICFNTCIITYQVTSACLLHIMHRAKVWFVYGIIPFVCIIIQLWNLENCKSENILIYFFLFLTFFFF